MRALRILAAVAGGAVGLVVLLFVFLQTPPGQRALAAIVSGESLKVSGVSGFFPTDLGVERIELLDRQGPWLRIGQARLHWSFASLFEGRLRIENLSAASVDVERQPEPQPAATTEQGGGFGLPLGVDLQAFSIDALHLAAPLAGVESRWKLRGNALLPADLHEGRLRLTGDRTDGPTGRLSANIRFDAARLTVDGEIALEEGKGGVVAALLQRPDLDQVALKLTAKGDAASGNGELTVSAGDAVTAKGTARWQPADTGSGTGSGTGTAVSVQLEAGGTQLARRGGPVSLTAEATVDERAAILRESTLAAGPARLTASGRYDRTADRLDGTVTLQSDEPGPFAPLLGGVGWRGLGLTAHAVLENLAKQPQGSVALSGRAEDLTVASLEGRLPPLGPVTLEGKIGLQADGRLTLDALDVASAVATVKGDGGSYLPKTKTGEVKAVVDLPDLELLSGLAGRKLAGHAHLALTARTDAQGLIVGWQGTLANAGAPDVPPGLIAREITLSGTGTLRNDDTWSLADVKVASEAASFGLSGHGQGSAGTFDLSVDLRELSALNPELTGAVTASSTIELRTDGTAGGSLSLSGETRGQPVSLAGQFDRDAAGGIVVPSFEGHWASAILQVTDLAITQARTSGSAHLAVGRLEDIGGLLGTDLAGSIEADVNTDPQLAAGRLQVSVSGSNIRSGDMAVGTLKIDGTVDEPMGAIATDARISASGLRGVGEIASVNGTVKGGLQGGFDVALQASGAGTAASLTARIEPQADAIRVALSRFEGRHAGIAVALNAPTRLQISGSRVAIDPTTLRLGGGRLAVQGVLDPTASDLRLDLAALPLSLLDTFAPGTGLEGTLQARVRVTGAMADPRVEATYNAENVRLRRPEAGLLPSLGLRGTASLVGQQASLDARLSAGGAGNLALKGKAALPQGGRPLSGSATITGSLDVAPFAPLIGNQVRNVAGTLRPNLTIDIAGSKITGSGSLDLSNGAINLPEAGMRLAGGSAHVVLQDDTLQVQRLAFQTGRSGELTASGTLRLAGEQGLAVDLAVAARHALLVNRPDLVATISSDLKVTGTTADGIDVAGPITVERAEIAVGTSQPADYPTIDVREINKPGAAPPPPSSSGPPQPPPPSPTATPIRLALDIQAPQGVFVRGRGLDAEMGGSLKVTGSPTAPQVIGGLTMRRGDFTLGGRRLVFSRGVVTLDNLNRIDPRLDFVASTTVEFDYRADRHHRHGA